MKPLLDEFHPGNPIRLHELLSNGDQLISCPAFGRASNPKDLQQKNWHQLLPQQHPDTLLPEPLIQITDDAFLHSL